MVRTKVFVGNLSFTTKENELAKEFEAAGKVISANIITRGPRSLGYGFVEMDNETDAENAVKLLDKKEIDGRPINVEVAKPREEGATDAQAANAQPGSTRGGRGGRGGDRRGGARGGAQGGQGGRGGQSQQSQSRDQQGQQGQGQQGGFRRQFRRREDEDEGEDQQSSRGGRGGRGRGGRAPRAARPEGEENRTPSQTTLFVANLPFSLEDDAFSKVLKDASLAYKTAHVVRKRTGRSKGFGFIEFDNEGDQQKALAALNDKDLEGRQLVVKVALTELRSLDNADDSAPAKTSSPAPAKASSSPAPAKAATTEKKDEKPATPKQDRK